MLRLVNGSAMHRLPSEAADPRNDMRMRAGTSKGILGGLPGRRRPSFAAIRWLSAWLTGLPPLQHVIVRLHRFRGRCPPYIDTRKEHMSPAGFAALCRCQWSFGVHQTSRAAQAHGLRHSQRVKDGANMPT